MIKINGLSKSYENNIDVLKDISIDIDDGEIYGIIGHSGAGKSTLLRCINGLEQYNSGSLTVDGQEVSDLTGKELRVFRKNLGMIFQSFNLLERKTVYENVSLPLQVWREKGNRKKEKEEISKRVHELLELVGLSDKLKSKPKELSGGQKQRVAIARALALNPKILLCDEATSALDPKTTKDILMLLSDINKKFGITIVIVTHQMEVIKEVCEKVALIDGGKIMAKGYAKDLFLNPSVPLKKFLGDEEEDEMLPNEGVNIKIFFHGGVSKDTLITSMARELKIDFSIVWGKLEKFREDVLGSLVINLSADNKEKVENYLREKNITWEVL
ncbi:MAG: methionine ABC transporter ATP-binding protein [Inconstantimicrobium porci]|uniref:methionine ABC transporter ATP-binding protein n=1 Tax=Inconstantimicrobium porci TaxID=2652291 RepID=UPI0024093646|nr:methionine ABC transporter ATP-binding protein [Inconstantimicrobium porci]MDD6770463.1 methionine ABC transporter ATP-binding protein [Inconstantimicrobium porci]MDY5911014.1 methionine ABC transporter ATP-binding protein [Inconstantimicrobium porci]